MIKKTFFPRLCGAIAMGLSLLVSSCFEAEDEYTLNPDGSGKVKHECSFQPVNLTGDGDEGSEEELQKAVIDVLEEAKGVEAWKDVSFKRLDDGRIWFRGTAYFRDLAKFEIPNQSMLKFAWDKEASELRLVMNDSPADGAKQSDLSDEEKAEKLKVERGKYQQSKPMMAAILGGMKHEASFRLSGAVAESHNFSKLDDGRLGLTFDGAKMIEVMDTVVNDDEWMLAQGFDQKEGPNIDDKLSGMMFGEEGPVMARLKGAGKALFDYEAEVAVAKKETAELQKKLGAASIAPPAKGEPLKSVSVVGVRMIQEIDKKLNLRPFNYDTGMTFSILAELPGSVLDFTDKCHLTTATADDGSSLLKGDKDWDRRISFPRLSEDKANVLFETELKLPGEGVKSVEELSGVLEYRVAGATKEVELGVESFEEGSKGKALSAEVTTVEEPDSDGGSQRFGLKLKIRPDDLVVAYVLSDGVRSELSRNGYGSSGGSTNFTFTSPVLLEEVESIQVEIHDELKVFEVPFKLENLSF